MNQSKTKEEINKHEADWTRELRDRQRGILSRSMKDISNRIIISTVLRSLHIQEKVGEKNRRILEERMTTHLERCTG